MAGHRSGRRSGRVAADSSDFPLGQLLVRAANLFPDSPYLLIPTEEDDRRFESQTFVQTLERATSVTRRLLQQGLTSGEPVALFGDCAVGRFSTAFGIWLAGGVVLYLDPEWSPEALGRALVKVEARIGITDPPRMELLREAAYSTAGFVCLAEDSPPGDFRPESFPEVDPASRALILFTSGTTGEPKAAAMQHRGLLWNTRTLSNSIGVTSVDNLLGGLPLHHMAGLVASLLLPVHSGARVALPKSLTRQHISECMRATRVTLVATVPQLAVAFESAIQNRVRAASWPRRLLFALTTWVVRVCRLFGFNPGPFLFRSIHEALGGRLRMLGSGSAPLDPQVARRLWAVGLTVVEGYGLTETGPAICFDDPNHPSFGSVGFPLPGVDLRIQQPDLEGVGEVLVRSPACFEGYVGDPEATDQILRDGWIVTGDLGRIDRAGRLFLTGRVKEVVVLGSGLKVYPHEIERRLDDNPYIAESCVLGRAIDGRPGSEKLHAVVVPDFEALRQDGILRIEATLRDRVNKTSDRLPSHHRIMGLTIRGEPLPRTPIGKLKRFQVEMDLATLKAGKERMSSRSSEILPASPYWRHVENVLCQVSHHPEPIAPSNILELDLGLDSLARIEVLSELERALNTKLPEGFGVECLTAGDLLAAIESFAGEGGLGQEAGFKGMAAVSGEVNLMTFSRRLLRPVGLLLARIMQEIRIRVDWGSEKMP